MSSRPARRAPGLVWVVVIAVAVVACGSSATPAPSAAPSPVPTTVAIASAAPSDSPMPLATLAPSASPAPPSAAPSATATPKPTSKPTPRPAPKPTFNPNWTVKAKVGNGVLTPSAGTSVDTVTWRVLSAADGARCELYLYFFTGGPGSSTGGEPVNNGNQTDGGTYHAGASNTFVMQLAPDQHEEYATYTLGCWLQGGEKRWATPGQISIQ